MYVFTSEPNLAL